MTLIGGRRLKEGDAYFKVSEIIQLKFQKFVIFFFQVTENNCHIRERRYSGLSVNGAALIRGRC